MFSVCQIHEVIGVVYQYIRLLRQSAPQEWIFKELQDIGNMEFRFAEEQPQDDYAAELAGSNDITLMNYVCRIIILLNFIVPTAVVSVRSAQQSSIRQKNTHICCPVQIGIHIRNVEPGN